MRNLWRKCTPQAFLIKALNQPKTFLLYSLIFAHFTYTLIYRCIYKNAFCTFLIYTERIFIVWTLPHPVICILYELLATHRSESIPNYVIIENLVHLNIDAQAYQFVHDHPLCPSDHVSFVHVLVIVIIFVISSNYILISVQKIDY